MREILSDEQTYEDSVLICMLINMTLDLTFLIWSKYFAACFKASHLPPHSQGPAPLGDSRCYSRVTKTLQKKIKKKPKPNYFLEDILGFTLNFLLYSQKTREINEKHWNAL